MCAGFAMRHSINPQVAFAMEVSGYLVGSAAFKAVGTSEPRLAGSIPVRLRQTFDVLTCEFNRKLRGHTGVVFSESKICANARLFCRLGNKFQNMWCNSRTSNTKIVGVL